MNLPITGYKAKSEYTHPNGTKSIVYLMDNMDFMEQVPPKFFELACVDPPYGLPERSGQGAGKLQNRIIQKMHQKGWDIAPTKEYFTELKRISNNQIIWGGNYFEMQPTRGFIIWDKQQPFENFSACEFAWTSFDMPSKIFVEATTRTGETKIHPTQKSVKLYDWIFHNYAKQGDKILDTHLGSGSSRIAAYKHGLDFVGVELDEDYFKDHEKRFKNFVSQLTMF